MATMYKASCFRDARGCVRAEVARADSCDAYIYIYIYIYIYVYIYYMYYSIYIYIHIHKTQSAVERITVDMQNHGDAFGALTRTDVPFPPYN